MPTALLNDAPAPRRGVLGVLGLLRMRIIRVPAISRKRKAVALAVAFAADLTQIVLWPAFVAGAGSPFDDALDAVVALVLLLTLGFSVRLALALMLELLPGAALFPTWLAVVASIPTREAPVDASSPIR